MASPGIRTASPCGRLTAVTSVTCGMKTSETVALRDIQPLSRAAGRISRIRGALQAPVIFFLGQPLAEAMPDGHNLAGLQGLRIGVGLDFAVDFGPPHAKLVGYRGRNERAILDHAHQEITRFGIIQTARRWFQIGQAGPPGTVKGALRDTLKCGNQPKM